MPSDVDAIRKLIGEKSRVTPYVGRYVGADGSNALVDFGDQRFPVPFLTAFVPEIAEPVNVWSVDGSLFLVGPTQPKPGMGVVATVSGDLVSVVTDYGTFTMPYTAPTVDTPPPSSGDTVGIDWSSGAKCYRLSTSPDPVPPPPPPSGGGSQVQTATFRAQDAGSTDRASARWWTDRPYASNSTFGAWFYGSQVKDTIPAGAQYVSLEFYVSYQQRQGGSPRFTLHNDQTKGGVPGMSAYWEWSPAEGFQKPVNDATAQSWFNALKAGGDRAGVGLNQGGFNVFRSLAQDGMSGALRISWRS